MSKEWKTSEIQLLDSLANAYRSKNWRAVAKQMNKEGYIRTQVQCRYKWVNYIAPGINHNPWSQQELIQLFKGYELHKSQWALIQRSLPGRTQIKIRNQFYGTLRNLLRFSIKYFKTSNGRWSLISNQVKPQTLQNLYDGEDEFDFVGNTIKDAIKQMQFKFKKQKFDLIIGRQEETYQRVVFVINNSDCLIKRRKKRQDYEQDIQNEAQHQNLQQINAYHLRNAQIRDQLKIETQNFQQKIQTLNHIPSINVQSNQNISHIMPTNQRVITPNQIYQQIPLNYFENSGNYWNQTYPGMFPPMTPPMMNYYAYNNHTYSSFRYQQ